MTYTVDYDTLVSTCIAELTASTNITQLAPGAKARSILEIINARLSGAYRYLDRQLVSMTLSRGYGAYLDIIGEFLGLPRRTAIAATVSILDQNIYFYVNSGTFGDLNNGNDLTVPAGTQVTSLPQGSDLTDIIRFTLSDDVVLNAADSKQYISLEAMTPGLEGVAPQGSLQAHNFTAYRNTLLVKNDEAIANAQDDEDDDSYRYRLSQRVTAAAAANEVAVRLACLSLPGIADITIHPYAQGAGSFEVYILPIAEGIGQTLLSQVQSVIDSQQGLGCRGIAVLPRRIGIEFTARVYPYQTISDAEKNSIIIALQMSARNFFSPFVIGQSFYLNNLLSNLINADSRVRTIGEPQKPFVNFYIWKPAQTSSGQRRYSLMNNYIAAYNERVTLEKTSFIFG